MLYKVIDKLYISTEFDAKNQELLKKEKITHILNCAKNCDTRSEGIVYKYLPIDDTVNFPIENYFEEGHHFMDLVLMKNEGSAILVHCRAGLSRSASLIVSYLMTRKGHVQEDRILSLAEAYEFLEKKRMRRLTVNFGFFRKICDLETVKSVNYSTWLEKKIHYDLNNMIPDSITMETVRMELDVVKESDYVNNNQVNLHSYIQELERKVLILQEIALRKIQGSQLYGEDGENEN